MLNGESLDDLSDKIVNALESGYTNDSSFSFFSKALVQFRSGDDHESLDLKAELISIVLKKFFGLSVSGRDKFLHMMDSLFDIIDCLMTSSLNNFHDFFGDIGSLFHCKCKLFGETSHSKQRGEFFGDFCNKFLEKDYLRDVASCIQSGSCSNVNVFCFYMTVLCVLFKRIDRENFDYLPQSMDACYISFFEKLCEEGQRNVDSEKKLFTILTFLKLRSQGEDICPELYDKALDAVVSFLHCDFLEKKIMAAKYLHEIHRLFKETPFKSWHSKQNFIDMFIEKSFHESVIQKLSPVIVTCVGITGQGSEIFMKLFEKGKKLPPVQQNEVFNTLFNCVSVSDEALFCEFLTILDKNEMQTLDFLANLVIKLSSVHLNISLDVLGTILNLLESNDYALKKVLKIIELSQEVELCRYILSFVTSRISEERVNKGIIQALSKLIMSQTSLFQSDDTRSMLVECLTQRIGLGGEYRDELFKLLMLLAERTEVVLNSNDLERIIDFNNVQILDSLKFLMERRDVKCFSKDGYSYISQCLDTFDFSKATTSFSNFVCNFEVCREILKSDAHAMLFYSSSNMYINWRDIALNSDLKYVLKIINDSEDEPSAIAEDFITRFVTNEQFSTSELYQRFMMRLLEVIDSTMIGKIRILKLFQKIIKKTENLISLEDYGFVLHKPRVKTDDIIVKVLNNNSHESIDVPIQQSVTVSELLKKYAILKRRDPNRISSVTSENRHLHAVFSLDQIGITHGSTIYVKHPEEEYFDESYTELPSYVFYESGLTKRLLGYLTDDNDAIVKQESYDLLCLMQTDQGVLEILRSDKAITTIMQSDRLLQKYYLESCLTENNCSFTSDLLNSILNKEIKGTSIPSALSLIMIFNDKTLHEKYSEILDVATDELQLDDYEFITVYSRLLVDIIDYDEELFHRKFFEPDKKLSSKFDMLNKHFLISLSAPFSKLIKCEELFAYISNIVPTIEDNDLYMPVFDLLSHLISKECDCDSLFGWCVSKLPDSTGHLYNAIVSFLPHVYEIDPERLNIEILDILLRKMLSDTSEDVQKKILCILKRTLDDFPEYRSEVAKILLPHVSVVLNSYAISASICPRKSPLNMVGLRNHGATCYLNSVIQQLFSNRKFRYILLSSSYEVSWLVELQKIFALLQFFEGQYVETINFCECFNFRNGYTSLDDQQDAIEFLQLLLDKLPEEASKEYKGSFTNTFEGITEAFKSESTEEFFNITLDIKGFGSFEESFESFLADQNFVGENQYFSDTLNRKIDVRKYTRIDKTPNNLVVQLNRFEYNCDSLEKYKINERFEFPMQFDAAPYTKNKEECMYDLTGVIVHGGTLDYGHYYSIVRVDDCFYVFNDTLVKAISAEAFFEEVFGGSSRGGVRGSFSSAYLLFYSKVETPKSYHEGISENQLTEYLRDNVHEENRNFTMIQSVFSSEFVNIVLMIDNVDFLRQYLLNVFAHSSSSIKYDKDELMSHYRNKVDSSSVSVFFNSYEHLESIFYNADAEILKKIIGLYNSFLHIVDHDTSREFILFILKLLEAKVEYSLIMLFDLVDTYISKYKDLNEIITSKYIGIICEPGYIPVKSAYITLNNSVDYISDASISYLLQKAISILCDRQYVEEYCKLIVSLSKSGRIDIRKFLREQIFCYHLESRDMTPLFNHLLNSMDKSELIEDIYMESLRSEEVSSAFLNVDDKSFVINQFENLVGPYLISDNHGIREFMRKMVKRYLKSICSISQEDIESLIKKAISFTRKVLSEEREYVLDLSPLASVLVQTLHAEKNSKEFLLDASTLSLEVIMMSNNSRDKLSVNNIYSFCKLLTVSKNEDIRLELRNNQIEFFKSIDYAISGECKNFNKFYSAIFDLYCYITEEQSLFDGFLSRDTFFESTLNYICLTYRINNVIPFIEHFSESEIVCKLLSRISESDVLTSCLLKVLLQTGINVSETLVTMSFRGALNELKECIREGDAVCLIQELMTSSFPYLHNLESVEKDFDSLFDCFEDAPPESCHPLIELLNNYSIKSQNRRFAQKLGDVVKGMNSRLTYSDDDYSSESEESYLSAEEAS